MPAIIIGKPTTAKNCQTGSNKYETLVNVKTTNKNNKIVLFDKRDILMTILPTGGKRCNLGYQEFDNVFDEKTL